MRSSSPRRASSFACALSADGGGRKWLSCTLPSPPPVARQTEAAAEEELSAFLKRLEEEWEVPKFLEYFKKCVP